VAGPREASLATAYDLLMFDLDGVVYVDGKAVDHAAESIAYARDAGAHIAFITNNAARTSDEVAEHLRELGIEAESDDVVTSAQAAARLLRDEHGPGAPIAVLGAEGLVWAVREAGLEPVRVGDPRAVAIVSGYAPEIRWQVIMRGATLIRNGLPWVATNTDLTLPTGDGLAPGHGLLVRLISDFSGVTPQVAGKPERPLLDETRRRLDGGQPLMVGDRLDTDIEGAHRAGTDALLVMTGVSHLDDLVRARPEQRPTWIGHDLTALSRPGMTATSEGGSFRAGNCVARVDGSRLVVEGSAATAEELDAWWTVAAAAAWDHLDRTGQEPDTAGVTPPGSSMTPG
jgi:HAD superfamily hydrolase (TIGR01450 family)